MRSEIVLPITEPETEWVRGRALQKMSPTFRHGVAQMRIAAMLDAWASTGDYGRVATEWRCRVTPPGEATRPLVPDVAFISYEALPRSAEVERVDVPNAAPTLAVEILSPDDRPDDVDDRIATYLAAGTIAVLTVDPQARTATLHDRTGSRRFDADATIEHPAFPGLALEVRRAFES